jgi:YD repeat-containing protein
MNWKLSRNRFPNQPWLLVRTRRRSAPIALVTLLCFLATFVPPSAARADTAAATAPFGGGVGGPSSLGLERPMAESTSAMAAVDLPTGALTSGFGFHLQTARGEAQPSLGLVYNSSNDVGYAGVGWTLNVPFIERQATLGTPTFTELVPDLYNQLLAADDYVVNGQRLILLCLVVSSTTCGNVQGETFPSSVLNWNYFHTEIDDGARYFYDGATWIVQTKSGHLLQYGYPLDSHSGPGVDALSTNAVYPGATTTSGIYRWKLVRDTDASGNTVYYLYQGIGGLLGNPATPYPNASFLSDIYDTPPTGAAPSADYANLEHHVHITWELPLASNLIGFLLDPIWRAAPNARLKRVDVTSYGSTSPTQRELVRSYILNYEWNDPQTQYYLASVETHGTCGISNGIDNPIAEPAAFTAACPMLTQTTYTYDQISGATSVVPPTIKQTVNPGMPKPIYPDPASGQQTPYAYVDIDGDGRSDFAETAFESPSATSPDAIYAVLGGSATSGSYRTFSSQNPAGLQGTIAAFGPGSQQVVYGDWLGNGELSWLWMNANSTTNQVSPEVYSLVTGSIVGATLPAFQGLPGFVTGRAVDVDGDGLPDMTFVPAQDGSAHFTTTLSLHDRAGGVHPFGGPTISTCVTPDMDPTTYGKDSFRTMADMDGDGLPDMVLVTTTAPTKSSKYLSLRVFTNRGNGLFGAPGANNCYQDLQWQSGAAEVSSQPNPGVGSAPAISFDQLSTSIIRFGDLNGDHLADLAMLSKYGLYVCMHTGYSIAQMGWSCLAQNAQSLGAPAGGTLDLSQSGLDITDLEGLGVPQLVYFTPYNSPKELLFTSQDSTPVGALVGIKTSEGADTAISYTGVRTATPAAHAFGGVPAFVVSQISTQNGLTSQQAGRSILTNYLFNNPVYDAHDRVFAGFQTVFADQGGTRTTTTFATQSCSGTVECNGSTIDYGFFRAMRALVTSTQTVDPLSGGAQATTWNEYQWTVAYTGEDGRRVIQLPVHQQHFYRANELQALTSAQVTYLDGYTGDGTWNATLPIGGSGPEVRHQMNYDRFGNEISSVDFGAIGTTDLPIRRAMTWSLPSGDATGWNYRLSDVKTGYATGDGSAFSGSAREYGLVYYPNGQLWFASGVLSGTAVPPGPYGGTRAAALPLDASQDGAMYLGILTYDANGNVVKAQGIDTRCTVYQYDPQFGQWPIQTSVHLGGCTSSNALLSSPTYDAALEEMISQINPAGELTRYVYDNFGRVTEVDQPLVAMGGMTASSPAIEIAYGSGGPLRTISVRTVQGPESTPYYAQHYSYVDAFDDTIASIDESGDAPSTTPQWLVSGVHTVTGLGQVATVYRPFYLAAGADPSAFPADTYAYGGTTASFSYDLLGRATAAKDFDGGVTKKTYHDTALSVDLQDPEQTRAGPHSGSMTTVFSNGHGQVTGRTEHLVNFPVGDRTTSFAYQATGEPTQIVYPGGTSRWMQYDSLGRLVRNAEPNTSPNYSATVGASGVLAWTYAYNSHNELVATSDARGCGESIYHDDAGRIVAEDYSPCDAAQVPYLKDPLIFRLKSEA